MRGERIAAPLLALLIVFSGAGGAIAPGASPVGTAEAQLGDGSGGACESSDWFLTFITGTILTTDCKTAGDVSDEWNETDAIETRTQIHSQAGLLGAGNEQFLTAMDNSLLESDTIAFSKGEAAAVEVLANGGTIAEAQAAANESIEDYYTVKQRNLIDRWEVNVQTAHTLSDRAGNTTGVDSDFVTFGESGDLGDQFDSGATNSVTTTVDGTDSRTITLVNGSSASIQTLGMWGAFGGDTWATINMEPRGFYELTNASDDTTWDPGKGGSSTWGDLPYWLYDGGYYGGSIHLTSVKARPTDDLQSKTLVNVTNFADSLNEIEQKSQSSKEEVAVYINQSLGPAVESGELNATSYISPSTLAQEYATEYSNSTSYIDATAMAAYSGMSTPDLNQTGSMTVTHNGTTYQGLLLSQNAPDAGWKSGETYDPALLSGMQLFAVAGEEGRIIELDGPFTIDGITGSGGDEIQTADTETVTYETANTSEDYKQLQQQIRTLNEQIEERKAQATTGGSDATTNDGLLAKIAAALGVGTGVVLLVAAAVVVVAARFYLPDQ